MGEDTERFNKCINRLKERTGGIPDYVMADTSEPSYGRDGRTAAMMGKHIDELDLAKTNYGEYFDSRIWAAAKNSSWGGIIMEYLMAPVRYVRFRIRKAGAESRARRDAAPA